MVCSLVRWLDIVFHSIATTLATNIHTFDLTVFASDSYHLIFIVELHEKWMICGEVSLHCRLDIYYCLEFNHTHTHTHTHIHMLASTDSLGPSISSNQQQQQHQYHHHQSVVEIVTGSAA